MKQLEQWYINQVDINKQDEKLEWLKAIKDELDAMQEN